MSAVIDGVNHHGIHYKLSSVAIGGSVLSILTQFLSNRSLHVMVDSFRSKLVNVMSGDLVTDLVVCLQLNRLVGVSTAKRTWWCVFS